MQGVLYLSEDGMTHFGMQVDVHDNEMEAYSSFSESEDDRPPKRATEKMGGQTEMHSWRKDHPGATSAGKSGHWSLLCRLQT